MSAAIYRARAWLDVVHSSHGRHFHEAHSRPGVIARCVRARPPRRGPAIVGRILSCLVLITWGAERTTGCPMFVHRSNRLEELVGVLAEVVARPVGGALEPEVIVVQSKGMERWLGMQLSRRLGVWSNARFPFPRALVEELFGAVLDAGGNERFSREGLGWAISALLPSLAQSPAFSGVAGYLEDDQHGLKRLQLAQRIAYLFDQYAVFRPEMVLDWERGGGEGWQPALWRALVERFGSDHVAARTGRFLEAWNGIGELPPGVPHRISVFGISSLPPIYLRVLAAAARHVELHLFLLSPSREYWAEIRSEREALRSLRDSAESGREELHLEQGNALLASLGRAGRDFQRVLESLDDYQETDRDLYRDPGAHSMLAALQSDILALRRRGPGALAPPLPLDDASIAVHACHSPMREIQVLRDQLLDLFESDPSLEPHDVVVMMPDVRSLRASGRRRVRDNRHRPGAHSLSHRGPHAAVGQCGDGSVPVAPRICGGRARASEVLDLLQLEPIRARFGILASELSDVSHRIHDAGVRWGEDAADRERAGQPAVEQNSWRFGLERLLLGYAMPGPGMFAGVLPIDDMEGSQAELVGRLAEFAERLFAWRRRLVQPRTPADWQEALGRLLDDLVLAPDFETWQLQLVRDALAALSDAATAAGFDEPISLEVVRALLEEAFEQERTTHDFLAGGVTFCAMLPMRSIPFRVVCLVGMNDGDFPRTDRHQSFDLIRAEPRPGDRSPREEDRYLFLEALLSARERLFVSYVGRGIQDNGVRPPSVVLGELFDAVSTSFSVDRDRLVVEHPLQPFSPRYFRGDDDPRLFSYGVDDSAGARALVRERHAPPPFQLELLPAVGGEQRSVDIGVLARFFENPARGLLNARLRLFLERESVLVEDREPIELDHLERHKIGAALLEQALGTSALDDGLSRTRASGVLPFGTPGHLLYETIEEQAHCVELAARRYREGGRLPPLEVDLEIGDTRIGGALGELWQCGQLRVQYGKLKARQRLSTWTRHLALQLVAPAGYPRSSVVVARADDGSAEVLGLVPVEQERARELLFDVVELYWLGQRAALPLFPESSLAYVEALAKRSGEPDAEQQALRQATLEFNKKANGAEAQDVYIQRAFDGYEPLGDSVPGAEAALPGFAELARRVFEPMLGFVGEVEP